MAENLFSEICTRVIAIVGVTIEQFAGRVDTPNVFYASPCLLGDVFQMGKFVHAVKAPAWLHACVHLIKNVFIVGQVTGIETANWQLGSHLVCPEETFFQNLFGTVLTSHPTQM